MSKKVEQKKTAAEITAERIMDMPLDKEYKPVPNLPIPLHIGVLIKKLPKPKSVSLIPLATGDAQEIIHAEGDNAREPNLGIIMAVGPDCSPFVRVGLRCFWDVNQTGTFRHEGVDYYRMDHYCVYYIVPDASTIDKVEVKDARQVRLEKKQSFQKKALNEIHQDDLNEKDMLEEMRKGKNKVNRFLS